jgi:hypothetical protein
MYIDEMEPVASLGVAKHRWLCPGRLRLSFSLWFFQQPPESLDPGNAVVGFMVGAITGLVIGTLQWVVLRKVIPGAGWWVLATLMGVASVHAVGDTATGFVAFWMLALPSGVVVGILQWLVLRRLGSNVRFWVVASAVGWFVGLISGMAIAEASGLMLLTDPNGWVKQHSVVGSVTGAVVGMITGIALLWLVQQPISARKGLESSPQTVSRASVREAHVD